MKVFENFCLWMNYPGMTYIIDIHFYLNLIGLKMIFFSIFTIDYVKEPQNPISITNSVSYINLGNISTTVPIDIFVKPGIFKNIHIGASCMIEKINTYKSLFHEF